MGARSLGLPGATVLLVLGIGSTGPDGGAQATGSPRNDVTWISLDESSFEHLRLAEDSAGFRADGLIVRAGSRPADRIRYRISGDALWRTRELVIGWIDGVDPVLELRSDGNGHWSDRHRRLAELDGCMDVDIEASPFTNTIAIRRLALGPGESAETCVLFIDLPGFGVSPVEQRYSRLTTGAGPVAYRYENLETGFAATLPVDPQGLLLEYPGYFRRAGS